MAEGKVTVRVRNGGVQTDLRNEEWEGRKEKKEEKNGNGVTKKLKY